MSTETDTSIPKFESAPPVYPYPSEHLSYREFEFVIRETPPTDKWDDNPLYLNEHEFAALCALHFRENSSRWDSTKPSYVTLAFNMKASDSTAKRAVKSLIAKGWLCILVKGCQKCQVANVYQIRGVPPGVRETLALTKTGEEWFDSWCLEDTRLVSVRPMPGVCEHLALVSGGHTKNTNTRPQGKTTTDDNHYKVAGVSQTLDEEHLSPSLVTDISSSGDSALSLDTDTSVQNLDSSPSGSEYIFNDEGKVMAFSRSDGRIRIARVPNEKPRPRENKARWYDTRDIDYAVSKNYIYE